MITPSFRATISRATACAHRYTPLKLMALTLSHTLSSAHISLWGLLGSTSRRGMLMPALFTNIDLPKGSFGFSTIASTLSRLVTSVTTYSNFPFASSNSGALGLMSERRHWRRFAKIPAPQPFQSRTLRPSQRLFCLPNSAKMLPYHLSSKSLIWLSLRMSRTPVCLSSRNCIVQSFSSFQYIVFNGILSSDAPFYQAFFRLSLLADKVKVRVFFFLRVWYDKGMAALPKILWKRGYFMKFDINQLEWIYPPKQSFLSAERS